MPAVLSPEEVLHFLGCIGNLKHQTVLIAGYAAGLRVSEAVSLKPRHIDSQRMVLHIERGKGTKRPLRHALGKAPGELASLVANRKTTRLAPGAS